MKSREKRIVSGNHLEVECFPVTEHGHRHDRKHRLSKEMQRALNEKNAIKKITRLINANFVEGDTVYTLNYRADESPETIEPVLRDMQNYNRRVRRYRKKLSLPPLKYIYTIECTTNKKTGRKNWHIHGIMSAMDRAVAEQLWGHGDFTNTKRFQPTAQEGGEAFAKYISKKPMGAKRWYCSKNLKQPTVKTKDGTHTRSEMARIARERVDDRKYWERKYKGYRFVSATPVYNEFNGWWYIYVKMYRDTRTPIKNNSRSGKHTDKITPQQERNYISYRS